MQKALNDPDNLLIELFFKFKQHLRFPTDFFGDIGTLCRLFGLCEGVFFSFCQSEDSNRMIHICEKCLICELNPPGCFSLNSLLFSMVISQSLSYTTRQKTWCYYIVNTVYPLFVTFCDIFSVRISGLGEARGS